MALKMLSNLPKTSIFMAKKMLPDEKVILPKLSIFVALKVLPGVTRRKPNCLLPKLHSFLLELELGLLCNRIRKFLMKLFKANYAISC